MNIVRLDAVSVPEAASLFTALVGELVATTADPYLAATTLTPAAAETILAGCVGADDAVAFTARDGGAVLGFLACELAESALPGGGIGRVGYVSAAYVRPEARGRGALRALDAAARAWAAARGTAWMELGVLAANRGAAAAWARLGYEPFRVLLRRPCR